MTTLNKKDSATLITDRLHNILVIKNELRLIDDDQEIMNAKLFEIVSFLSSVKRDYEGMFLDDFCWIIDTGISALTEAAESRIKEMKNDRYNDIIKIYKDGIEGIKID